MPPVGYAPVFEALLPGRRLLVEPHRMYGNTVRGQVRGPSSLIEQNVFVPDPVDTRNVKDIRYLFHFSIIFFMMFVGNFASLPAKHCFKTCRKYS